MSYFRLGSACAVAFTLFLIWGYTAPPSGVASTWSSAPETDHTTKVTSDHTGSETREGQLPRQICYIYVLPLPKRLLNPTPYLASQCPRRAMDAGYRSEYVVARAINRSHYAKGCSSPSDARWILVPMWYTCWMKFSSGNKVERLGRAARYVANIVNYLRTLPLWRERSTDMLYLFTEDKGPGHIEYFLPETFRHLRRGLFLTTVGTYMYPHPTSFVPHWDVVIPSMRHVDSLVPPQRLVAEELRQRRVLAFWRGTAKWHPAVRANAITRFNESRRIDIKLGKMRNFTTFEKHLHQSVFAVYLPGHVPQRWSSMLGNVIHANSVPLIVNDCVHLPFSDVVPWANFSVRMSEVEFVEGDTEARLERLVASAQLDELVANFNRIRGALMFPDPWFGDALPVANNGGDVEGRAANGVDSIVASLRLREAFASQPARGFAAERRRCGMLSLSKNAEEVTRQQRYEMQQGGAWGDLCTGRTEEARAACAYGVLPSSWVTVNKAIVEKSCSSVQVNC